MTSLKIQFHCIVIVVLYLTDEIFDALFTSCHHGYRQ